MVCAARMNAKQARNFFTANSPLLSLKSVWRIIPRMTEMVVASASDGSLIDRYAAERDHFEAELLRHGALLFRGFGIDSQEKLTRAVQAIGGHVLDYVDGNSP